MTGIQAGVAAYNRKALVPQMEYGWDSWGQRLSRYATYEAYLNNTAYSSINTQSPLLKLENGLYAHTRAIYNPIARYNQTMIGFIYGGFIDTEHMTGGAIPIATDNKSIIDALRQLYKWSRWGEEKSLYVSHCSVLGDVGLLIVDDRQREKVRMEVVHPSVIRYAKLDDSGNVVAAVLEYQCYEDEDIIKRSSGIRDTLAAQFKSKTYKKTIVITKEEADGSIGKFRTYKDDKPFPFYTDASGRLVEEWDNEYGFVPLVIASHATRGMQWGVNGWYNTLDKINEINSTASMTNTNIKKIIQPILYSPGVINKDAINVSAKSEEALTVLTGPAGSELKPVVVPLDIKASLESIDRMLDELERDLPELALATMRKHGNVESAPAAMAGYSDAIGRIEEARGRYDHALVRAMQMAISIGGYNGYDGFEGFTLESYDRGNLEFRIKERPVIADQLSLQQRLTTLSTIKDMTPPLQRIALEEMGYDERQIDEIVEFAEQQQRDQVRAFAEGVFNRRMGQGGGQNVLPNQIQGQAQPAPLPSGEQSNPL